MKSASAIGQCKRQEPMGLPYYAPDDRPMESPRIPIILAIIY